MNIKKTKNMVIKFLPVIFLLMALTFMMVFEDVEKLTDEEKVEFKSLTTTDQTIDPRAQYEAELDKELVGKEFRVTANDSSVIVYDTEGNEIFETSSDEWEENRDLYNNKYNLN